jgi:hypothetical protein
MTKLTTKQKSKSYVLSNNVVINLANLPVRRRQRRRAPKQPTSGPTNESMPSGSTTVMRPTAFTNMSNLETQIQQARLKAIENGGEDNNGRFQNNTRLLDNGVIEKTIKDYVTPYLLRFENTANQKFRIMEDVTNEQRKQLNVLKTDFRYFQADEEDIVQNKYYNENDNFGAFGAIEGSDGFIAQGNNIPEHEANNKVEEIYETPTKTETPIVAPPEEEEEGPFEMVVKRSVRKKQKKNKNNKQEETESKETPQQQPQPQNPNVMDFDIKPNSPLKTRARQQITEPEKIKVMIEIPQQYQPTLKKVLDSTGKTLVATKADLLPLYSYLVGEDSAGTELGPSKLQTAIRAIMKQRLKEKATQKMVEEASQKPMFFDYGFA